MWLKWPVWTCGREQALSVRPDRRAVGADRAGGARAAVRWPSSGAFEAPRRGRDSLRQPHRVRVASTAARLSTVGDGVLVPQALARGRCGRPAARCIAGPCARCAAIGTQWPRPAARTPSRSTAPTPSGRPCADSMPARRSTAVIFSAAGACVARPAWMRGGQCRPRGRQHGLMMVRDSVFRRVAGGPDDGCGASSHRER